MESNAVRGQVILAASDFQQASSSEQQIPVLLGLTLFSAAGLGGMGAGVLDPQAWVPFVLVTAVLAIVLALTPRRIAQRMVEGKSRNELDTTFAFDDQGVTTATATSESRSAWSQWRFYRETKTAFVLYTNVNLAVVVPQRAFQDAEIPRLRALFQQHLQTAPRSRAWTRHLVVWTVLLIMMILFWTLARR